MKNTWRSSWRKRAYIIYIYIYNIYYILFYNIKDIIKDNNKDIIYEWSLHEEICEIVEKKKLTRLIARCNGANVGSEITWQTKGFAG